MCRAAGAVCFCNLITINIPQNQLRCLQYFFLGSLSRDLHHHQCLWSASLTPFSGSCTSIDDIMNAYREPCSKEDLLILPQTYFYSLNPTSLTPFPGACTFSNAVTTTSGKHLLEALSISSAPCTVPPVYIISWNQTMVTPTHYTVLKFLFGLCLFSHQNLISNTAQVSCLHL